MRIVDSDRAGGHAVADRIAAGQQPGARRAANIAAGIEIRQANAIAGQPVDVGRFDQPGAKRADIAVSEVIRKNQDNIRRRRNRRNGRKSQH